MSAFAVLFERSNTPLDSSLLNGIMERLGHRGPDGHDNFISKHLAMGHWHFWTTPEEIGERQPLKLDRFPFRIVLDGRLDNRSELLARLDLPASISDAALILHAYARWNENCFAQFVGEYAVVIHDEPRDQLVCARDALGDRTLYYAFHGSHVAIASEPWAVAAALPTTELDEIGITSYFAFQPTPNNETFFKNVYELPPAQILSIADSGERRLFSWNPDASRRTRYKRDEEYAEEFRALLEQSIRAHLRSARPVGVLMSGGLDSTSVACLAARMTAPARLKTISFVFDNPTLKECDERIYMNAVRDQWDTDSIQLPSDDLWPYKDWEHWTQTFNRPDGNIFRWIKHLVYDSARDEGLGVLLTGEGGDHLYAAGQDWLTDMLWERRLLGAMQGLLMQIRRRGWDNIRHTHLLQRTLRNLAKRIMPNPVVQRLRSMPSPPDWITPHAKALWAPPINRFPESLMRQENLLSLQTAAGITAEIPLANRHNLELRHPYRDRRLIEFIFSLPAYQLYYGGLYKHILRVAMKGILPEIIRTRPRPTALLSFYKLGMQKEVQVIEDCLNDPSAVWQTYIRPGWLRDHLEINAPPERVGTESMIAWLSVSFESWYKYMNIAIVNRSIVHGTDS